MFHFQDFRNTLLASKSLFVNIYDEVSDSFYIPIQKVYTHGVFILFLGHWYEDWYDSARHFHPGDWHLHGDGLLMEDDPGFSGHRPYRKFRVNNSLTDLFFTKQHFCNGTFLPNNV